MEARHRHAKTLSPVPHEGVVAFHVPCGRSEDTVALVPMGAPGQELGLLSYDALSLDLGILTHGVVNPPMTEEKLNRDAALVLQLDVVGKHEGAILRLGVRQGIVGLDPDSNTLGGLFVAHDRS